MIETSTTAHQAPDAASEAVLEALRTHHGEDINGMRSIDRDAAVLTLAKVLVHMLAPYKPADRQGVLDIIGQKAGEVHTQLVLQRENAGSA